MVFCLFVCFCILGEKGQGTFDLQPEPSESGYLHVSSERRLLREERSRLAWPHLGRVPAVVRTPRGRVTLRATGPGRGLFKIVNENRFSYQECGAAPNP